jgi:hypothetical protein
LRWVDFNKGLQFSLKWHNAALNMKACGLASSACTMPAYRLREKHVFSGWITSSINFFSTGSGRLFLTLDFDAADWLFCCFSFRIKISHCYSQEF